MEDIKKGVAPLPRKTQRLRGLGSTLPLYHKGVPILLANSSEQNLCGKICSRHGAKLDKDRTFALTNSTIMQSIGCVCRLIVISPAVSEFLCDRPRLGVAPGSGSPSADSGVTAAS